jgi:hypothetical protein
MFELKNIVNFEGINYNFPQNKHINEQFKIPQKKKKKPLLKAHKTQRKTQK